MTRQMNAPGAGIPEKGEAMTIRDTGTGERATAAFDVVSPAWRECYGCLNEIAPGRKAHHVRWDATGYIDPYHPDCFSKAAVEGRWAVR